MTRIGELERELEASKARTAAALDTVTALHRRLLAARRVMEDFVGERDSELDRMRCGFHPDESAQEHMAWMDGVREMWGVLERLKAPASAWLRHAAAMEDAVRHPAMEVMERVARPENRGRRFTPRGFEDFGELTDVDGNTVTVRQSSARLDTVHLFCKAARPADIGSYKDEATGKYLLSITSPILDRARALKLAAALTRFAGQEVDTAEGEDEAFERWFAAAISQEVPNDWVTSLVHKYAKYAWHARARQDEEPVLGTCGVSRVPHAKAASCVDWGAE